jgi:type IV secretory pathway VirJ component
LPFAYKRLPRTLLSHVVLISLLGLAKSADFEIRVSGWMGLPPGPEALPVSPELARIPPQLMQCFYGEKESDRACPTLAARGVEVIRSRGGHHFGGDYGALAERIMAGLKQRLEERSRPSAVTAEK